MSSAAHPGLPRVSFTARLTGLHNAIETAVRHGNQPKPKVSVGGTKPRSRRDLAPRCQRGALRVSGRKVAFARRHAYLIGDGHSLLVAPSLERRVRGCVQQVVPGQETLLRLEAA
jgi:hypothetical protein